MVCECKFHEQNQASNTHPRQNAIFFLFSFNRIIKYSRWAQCENKRLNMNLVQAYIFFLSFIFIANIFFTSAKSPLSCLYAAECDTYHPTRMNSVCNTIEYSSMGYLLTIVCLVWCTCGIPYCLPSKDKLGSSDWVNIIIETKKKKRKNIVSKILHFQIVSALKCLQLPFSVVL